MRSRASAALLLAGALVAATPNPVVRILIIGGDPLIPIPTLWAHLAIKPGMRYSDAIREKDVASLRKFYETQHLELGRFEGGIESESLDAKADTATVKYNIYVARISTVDIVDKADVGEATVRELLALRPGMPLNTESIKADERRLRDTGKFRTVRPTIREGPDPKNPQDVTLVWNLSR
jgi:outer membrane protein assembly factor BamA